MAHPQLRPDARAGSRRRAIAAATPALGRTADRDPVRQRHRARAARVGRADERHSLRPNLGAVLADVRRLRQAEVDHGDADAGPRICRQRQGLLARHRGRGAARRRDRRHRRSGRAPGDIVRRASRRAADRCRRRSPRQGRTRHRCQDPVHLRLDRLPEGRHQHPADALLQPGDDPGEPAVHRRRAAGAGRLAAVEPHLRRQPRFRHGAVQRRLVLHRRGQAAARRHRSHGAQPSRDRADHPSQRAQGLRDAAAVSAERRGISAEFLQPTEGAVLRRRRPGATCLGRVAADGRRHDGRAHHLPGKPWLDRDGAGSARPHLGVRASEQHRAADPRRRDQAGAERRQVRLPLQRPERHAGLLAAAGPHQRRVRRGRLLQDRRCAEVRRRRRSERRACCSTGALPRTSSLPPAPGSALARCGRSSSIIVRRSFATR